MADANNLLLLGAGFSKNWGGWLASEVFEYLIGCRGLHPAALEALWRTKDRGGFEAALAVLGDPRSAEAAASLERGVQEMFGDMNAAFSGMSLSFAGGEAYALDRFLSGFNAIFTLNQDTLLEHCYLNDNIVILSNQKWNSWTLPGLAVVPTMPTLPGGPPVALRTWIPISNPSQFQIGSRLQPYFKLHGSSNWVPGPSGGETRQLLVLGGNKSRTIAQSPLLKWYQEQFDQALRKPNTRLLVIGYGFGDDHINALLKAAAKGQNLRIFVIDPNGVDVIDHNRHVKQQGGIYKPGSLAEDLWPIVAGASRRSLSQIFGGDTAELSKVRRFLRDG